MPLITLDILASVDITESTVSSILRAQLSHKRTAIMNSNINQLLSILGLEYGTITSKDETKLANRKRVEFEMQSLGLGSEVVRCASGHFICRRLGIFTFGRLASPSNIHSVNSIRKTKYRSTQRSKIHFVYTTNPSIEGL